MDSLYTTLSSRLRRIMSNCNRSGPRIQMQSISGRADPGIIKTSRFSARRV